MPLYQYSCRECGFVEEVFFPLKDLPDTLKCKKCGGEMHRDICAVAIQCDSIVDVKWLPSALETLQPDGEKPIETRGEYKKYLKEKNIIAAG